MFIFSNFSSKNPFTVLEVVKEISNATGNKLQYQILDNSKYEIKYQYLKSQKSRNVLKWYPRHAFAEGISKTIKWFRSSLIIG